MTIAPEGQQGGAQDTAEGPLSSIYALVDKDHQATVAFIARVTATQQALRAAAISVGSLAAGLIVANDSWPVALAVAPIVVVLALGDAYLEQLYAVNLARSTKIEGAIQSYITYLREKGPIKKDAQRQMNNELDRYEFGVARSLRRPTGRQLWDRARRKPMLYLYPLIVLLLAAAALAAGLSAHDDAPAALCVGGAGGSVLRVEELPDIESGTVAVTKCPD